MQVRKFEAKSIRDAIELVKFHLGPDAIILSAKENVKGFGLVGESSVEVTAAVSEQKLMRKKMAEKKLDSKSKERFARATATNQKQFISKVFHESELSAATIENEYPTAVRAAPPPEPPLHKQNGITSVRYAEIDSNTTDDFTGVSQAKPKVAIPIEASINTGSSRAQQTALPSQSAAGGEKVALLQQEITYLKSLLDNFQRMPQGFVSMHPGAQDGLPYELSFVYKKLADAGISQENIVEILKKANQLLPAEQKKKKAFVDGWVIKYLLDHIQIVEKPFKKRFQIFVGPTGQGKTSTVVKLACQQLLKEKKRVALISGDNIKVGASDQFKIYAQILNVPYAMINGPEDWQRLAPQLTNIDYIFVDTPGVNLKNPADLDTIKRILPPGVKDADTHFVQSIMARDGDVFEIADRFRIIGFDDVIFTRLDEAVQHGLIYNFQRKFQVPLHSFGIGNTIPDDFELATKERVIDLVFNLSNFRRDSSKERG